ncbi:hypothetical protein [uncultured Pelagimonas sp.]|uniref:calcium-binding protein n=1 Tax=uncultured Pelagimonas sp. TaxID=1618102 RepID=UPI0026245C7C|nr:hypothetical protein [uncultured Pelagimonas sp.]
MLIFLIAIFAGLIIPALGADSASNDDANNGDDIEDGHDGNDTVPVDIPEVLSFVGSDEDESFRIPTVGSINAQGGAGDDTFMDVLYGDEVLPENAGSDTGPVTIEGGSGDDKISLRYLGAQDATLSGGEGEDLIRLNDVYDNAGDRFVVLGEGSDTLAVGLSDELQAQNISIEDFDETEDLLVFEFPSNLGIYRTLDDAGEVTFELSQNAIEGTNDNAVTLTLTNLRSDGTESTLSQTVILNNSGPISEDSISIARFEGGDQPYDDTEPAIILAEANGGVISVAPDTVVVTSPGDDEVLVNNTTSSYSGNQTTVFTTAGNDTISSAGEGRSGIRAGEGDDIINYNGVFSGLKGESGNDTISAEGSSLQLYGGTGDDVLTDVSGGNSVFGGDGNDTLTGSGVSALSGGGGDDLIRLTPDDYWDTSNHMGFIFGGAFAESGDDVIEMYVGQYAGLGPYIGDFDPEETDKDTIRITVLESHLDRGPALVTEFGAEDRIELTAPQAVLDDLEIETVLADDGTTFSYMFSSNGTALLELQLKEGHGENGGTGSLSNPQFALVAA